MNERSGSDQRDPDLFSIINDAYNNILTKKKTFKNNILNESS